MMSTSDSCKDSVCDVNNMSTADNNIVSICANCGKGEEESSKLKNCTACKMVKYCSRECQIAHRPQHKKECKKRAAELYDEKVFKQPPPEEDCPICFQQLPVLATTGRRYKTCCGKVICSGCIYAPVYDSQGNKVEEEKCPFCRTPKPTTDEEIIERTMKRAKLDDPDALHSLGMYYFNGTYGFEQDYNKALEHWHRAGELGHAAAYCSIGSAYYQGRGVEVDKKKTEHYWELSAMGGCVNARYNLGNEEVRADNVNRALKHHLIAVGGGYADSLEAIKELYSGGFVTKDNYMKALRSYQTYLGEIKSVKRDNAAAAHEEYRYY